MKKANRRFTSMQANERATFREYLMFVQRGKCYYCGCQMERHAPQKGVPVPPNAITFEHLLDEWSPGGKSEYTRDIVLSCLECNNARGMVRQMLVTQLLYRTFPAKGEAGEFLKAAAGTGQPRKIRQRLEQFGLIHELNPLEQRSAA